AWRADARVGDHDVEATELLDAAVDRGLERVIVTHVHLCGDDSSVERLDHVRGLCEILGRRRRCRRVLDLPTDVDRDDVGALLRQPDRVTAALPTRRPCDESYLAFHPSRHSALLIIETI